MIDEGYIKYQQEHLPSKPLDEYLIAEINEYRGILYQMELIGAYDEVIGYGNISIKLPNGSMLISGTQTGQTAQLGPEHYTIVTSYSIPENKLTCQGPIKASSEALTHAAVYELREDIKAVIHVHSKALWEKYLDKMPTTSPEISYGTPQMASEVKRLYDQGPMQQNPVMIMAGHEEGIVTFGSSLKEAFEALKRLL